MATKELSIKEKLVNLHNLQVIDSKTDELTILKGALPMEVQDLEDEITGLTSRVTRLNTTVESIKDEENRHRGNIKDSENLILKYEKQLDNVKNNREFTALTKEIELQRLEIQLSEKRIKEALEQITVKTETLGVTTEKLESRNKDLEDKKKELEKILTKTEKEERKLGRQAKAARALIEERLLKSYDKIRKNYRNGLAVVPISRDACGGCFNRVPPQTKIEIGQRKKILVCEHCGRVLVDDVIAGKEQVAEEAKK